MAVDRSGSLFIADTSNCAVRKVSAATGIITTVAGTGICGETGNGGPATSAELEGSYGVAVDPFGTMYIADYSGGYVRSVSRTGTIHNFAGTGSGTELPSQRRCSRRVGRWGSRAQRRAPPDRPIDRWPAGRGAVRISGQGAPAARTAQSHHQRDDDEHGAERDARVAPVRVLADAVNRVPGKERRQRVRRLREVQHASRNGRGSNDEQDCDQDGAHRLILLVRWLTQQRDTRG